MKKLQVYFLLILMIAMTCKCCLTKLVQEQIKLGSNVQMHDLEKVGSIDFTNLNCDQDLLKLQQSIQTWIEILKNKDYLEDDVNNLSALKLVIANIKNNQNPELPKLFQYKQSYVELVNAIGSTEQTAFDQWRQEGPEKLIQSINLIEQAESSQDILEYCTQLDQMINLLINEREELKQQINTSQLVVDQLEQKSKEVQQALEQCKLESQQKPQVKQPEIQQTIEDNGLIHESSVDQEKPVFENTIEKEQEFIEYGYGYWLRFLTLYPKRLENGKDAPWYFLSRLTSNKNYQNIAMNDRLLAIWLGQGFYHFTTCDEIQNQPNIVQNINHHDDIEGQWTYIYYSYNSISKQAVAIIQFGLEQPQQITHNVLHTKSKYLRFLVGGKDNNQYPGFNGQFSSIFLSTNPGAFISTIAKFSESFKTVKLPTQDFESIFRVQLIDQEITRNPSLEGDYMAVGGGTKKFPLEYSISGWFKWEEVVQQVWHSIFRVQINKPSTDKFLGDRTLCMFIGTAEGGIFHFPTYSYQNMKGEGTSNLVNNIHHNNKHLDWFFVYFGYSKKLKKAFVQVRLSSGIETLEYNDVNHYYTPQFHTYVGKDEHFPGFNGKIAYVNFVLGSGSYRNKPDFIIKDDLFGYDVGDTNLIKKVQKVNEQKIPVEVKKEEPIKPEEVKPAFQDNEDREVSFESTEPVLEKEYEECPQVYGYGFWLRFMHAYPKRLLQGKNAPWYFISRLTSNRKYDNVQMGDRLLAVWLGQSFYHFTTCDTQKNQANIISNIDYPADIEGVWTYIHYSYSKSSQTANSFIRYSQSDIQSTSIQVQHPEIDYLKFIFGGNDQNRYPGFNGFISKIMITISKDNLLQTKDEFIAFMSKLEQPKIGLTNFITYQLIENETQRQDSDESLNKTLDDKNQRFPQEYAMSGWFKWIGPQRTPWHNIFRIQIQSPSTDIYLGDRTLCMWLGSIEGGVLHFPTYTYDNTNSKGNPNYYKNIKHNQRHLEWFYVYFGYQKSTKSAYVQVAWSKETQDILYENINHYLTPSFYIFVGKDNFYPGLSGKLAYVYFNLGNGSFKMKNEISDIVESYLKGNQVIKSQISNTQKKEQEQSTQEIKQVNQDIKVVNQEAKQVNQEIKQTNQEQKQTTQETKQVISETKQTNQETQQVNQETKQVVQETKQTNQETQQVNQETKQTNQETKQINQETKQTNQETKQVNQETKQVNQETKQTNQETQQVNQETKQTNQEVKQITQETKQVNQEIKQSNQEVKQTTQEIKQSNQETKQVNQETKQVNQEMKSTTQEIKQVNQEVKQETKQVNQETQQVSQEIQQTNQQTKQTTQEVKQTNQESKQVNQEVKQMTQENKQTEQTKQVTQEIKQVDQKLNKQSDYNESTQAQQTAIPGLVPFDDDGIIESYSDTPGLKPGKIDQSEQQECQEQINDKDTPLDRPIEKKAVSRTVQQKEQTSEETQAVNQQQVINSQEIKVEESRSNSEQNQEITKVDQKSESSQINTQDSNQVTETTSQTNSITKQTNDVTSITNKQTSQTNETIQQNNKTIQETNETIQQNNKSISETNETIQQNNQQINQSTQQTNSQATESTSTQITEEISKTSEQIDTTTEEMNEQEQHDYKIIDHKNEETNNEQTIDMPTQEDDYCGQDQDDELDEVKEIKIILGKIYENQISNDKEGKNPIVDQGITVANNYQEYGYGFWMRFLTLYPKELIKGKDAPWYFISRLARNKNYENIKLGDRVLAIWQGAGFYHFTTYNIDGLKPNVLLNVDYPNDIEGVWTYIYYSYSAELEQTVGHIKFGNQKFTTIKQNVKHAPTTYLRFILGGNDQNRFPSFNGIFTKITFGIKKGTYLQTSEQLIMKLNIYDVPQQIGEVARSVRIVENQEARTSENMYEYKEIRNKKVKFPSEYALSGWFKWTTLMEKEWHNLFRIQIRKEFTDSFLGDRTLSCWIGKTQGGVYQFPTYTYTNMIGNGNANLYKNINLKERHTKWHFIYFGYSKIKSQANAYVKWQEDEDQLLYENVNHYYVKRLYVYVGKDKFYPGLNGKMAYVVVNFGFGAYKNQRQFDEEMFNFNLGMRELIKNTSDEQFQLSIREEKIEQSGFDSEQASFEQDENGEKSFMQYGYGYWMRFLTLYPKKLLNGKTAPWYFVSRMTWNQNYNDINMGDRALAVFLGKGFYQFSTCNLITKNTNQEQRITHPDDIEGVWTFVYYSYSKELGKAVGFIRFGNDKFQKIQHTQVTHQDTKYLKLIVGGTDKRRYPGFNGQFAKISFSSKEGSFVDQEKVLKSYTLERRVQKIVTMNVLGDQQQRKTGDEGVFAQSDKVDLPTEYAISGWFKWLQVDKQEPLHSMFKVTIRNPTDDQLGDKTLVGYVGANEIQFSTYSFENMDGSGNKDIQRKIEHKNRHYRWFFVYFGYQHETSTCHVHIQWSDEMSQQGFAHINHYLTNQFYIYVGKEPLVAGFNGLITQVKFNMGEGTFKQSTNYKDQDNIFGFDLQTIKKEVKTFDITKSKEKIMIDSNSEEESNYMKVFNKDELDEVFEYGYGFWLRYLRNYPKVQIQGLKVDWSFISRLSKNDVLQDVTLGDRTLAIWLGKGFYHFTTYNSQISNIFTNVNHPADIEGLWTFIHYSHNLNKEQSVSFIQFGNDKPIRSAQQSVQLIPTILKFYLGGRHLTYKGFNGQISGAYVSVNKGIYIDSEEKFQDLLKSIPQPATYRVELIQNVLVEKNARFDMNSEAKQFEFENQKFSGEYSWSGWFKWSSVIQNAWHLAVRLSTIENYENKNNLGDRTLCLWIGQQAGGILYFSTYTYTDLYGSGNANSVQNVQYKEDITKWHFIYFGYSRVQQLAYGKVEFGYRKEQVNFEHHHHYLPNKFFLSVGKDKWHDPYLGNIAYLRFQSGQGAFHQGEFKEVKDDLFANKFGSMELLKPKIKFDIDKDAITKMFASPQVDQKEPIFSKIFNEEELDNVSEYGYGFWCRFLTRYPTQLIEGLKADWSFISRLTKNQDKGDMNYGDRTLAIWLGKGFYHFTTYSHKYTNVVHNIDHPVDIEGLWTFIHFSHNLYKKESVALIKFGEGKVIKGVIPAIHQAPTFLQLYIGGNNMKYAAYNGQFAGILFSIGEGIFLSDEQDLIKLLDKLKKPNDYSLKLQTKDIIAKPKQSFVAQETVFDDVPLVGQYSWSGWFKWRQMGQQLPWYLMVRLAIIKNTSDIKLLGDRTLMAFMGQGYIHFTTYTYKNIYGEGTPNIWQNINHDGEHVQWHFVYFGYSRAQRLAYGKIYFDDWVESVSFKDTNHFVPNLFALTIGKDTWFNQYNGDIGYFRFNAGEGAFQMENHDKAQNDIFAFKIGRLSTINPNKPPPEEVRKHEYFDNSQDSEAVYTFEISKDIYQQNSFSHVPEIIGGKGQITKNEEQIEEEKKAIQRQEQELKKEAEKFKNEKSVGIIEGHYQFSDSDKQKVISDEAVDIIKPNSEQPKKDGDPSKQTQQQEQQSDWDGLRFYGYGFYLRYLTLYPQQLRDGKNAPYYFVSRLTWNSQPQDVGMGDRVLSIFQGQGSYSFHTLDKPSNNPNLRTIIPYGDIEGVWTFVYFSYSQVDKKAVAFIKYDDSAEIYRRDMVCNHGDVEYLKLQIGGKQGIYQGFNGQIANYAFKFGKTAYVNDFALYKKILANRIPHPVADDYKFNQIKIIEPQTGFKGDEQTDSIQEIESHFQNEYAISGWLRWDQPIGVPYFALFRLSGFKVEDNNDSKLGDREMMLFKHTQDYIFQSYNYHNLNGAGDFAISWQVNHQEWEQFWHFFYIGYKRESKQLYYYVSFIDDEFDQVHNNIHHFIVHKHYLQFGRDYSKFYSKHRGFTGQATQVLLSYGKGSFQIKPFNDDIFMYLKGVKELFSSLQLITRESDRNKLLIGDANKPGTLMDLEINDGADYNIRGLNEYGWALWCRWSRTLTRPIQFKEAWYSLARIANRKGHQDLAVPGDRTLATWIGLGFYLFSTYTRGVLQVTESIPYGKFEGQWNFIVFSYRKNMAKASVLFGQDSTIVEKEFKVKHNMVKDYLRFVVGQEFGYKCFNGHIVNIQLRMGSGAYLTKEEIVIIANGELGLPAESKYDQSRKSIEIVKDRIPNSGQGREFDVKEDVAQGKLEYSISGWAKWVDIPAIQPWYVLYRVAYYDYNELLNMQIPGSRIFQCHKAYGFYHFNTYTVDQENGGAWQIVKNVDYDITQHKNWVFFYQGYSHSKQQVHLYVKFPGFEEHFTFININHFVAQRFKVHFLLDRWSPGFNGFLESWYFNVGSGSYKESEYGIGENTETTFGFGLHKPAQPKNWQFNDNYPCGFTQQNVGQEVEYKDDLQIDGLVEYGYGMWTRFAWNTPIKIINKPTWMALSRLTVNPNYQGDAAQLGDRALAIWVGPGYYHFTTSTRGNYNVVHNIEYDQMLDGQWNYIWFGYKRINDKLGTALGYVAFDGQIIRKTNLGNILQQPLNDYLYLAVGSSGRYFLDRYHQFNGHIQKVSLILGSGGFVENEDLLRKQIPSKPEFLRNQKQFSKIVIDEIKNMKREEWVPAPVEFAEEFDGAYEYSVSLWFKWNKTYRVAWENIFSLSYNEQNIRANHAKPGDRVLSMFQYADHRIFFSTYTTPGNHDQFAQLYTECPVDIPSQSEWVYGYYAYSRNQNKIISYLQTKTQKCLKALSCMHRVPKYMGLYVGKDGIHTPYNGKFSKLYFMGHSGSYIDGNFQSFGPFAAGGVSITKPAYFWSDWKENFEIAYDQNKVIELKAEEVDEQTSYSIGMWTKYFTAIPKRLLQKPDWLHLARLTVNPNHKNYENVGDRTLAIFIGRSYYGFFTYNSANNNPNIVQNIRYDDNFEGEWNFIYFSYTSELQLATGLVKFSKLDQIQRIQFRDIQHKPIDNYAKLVIGTEFQYQGFNGQIANLQLGFGKKFYVHDSDALNKIILEYFKPPGEDEDDNRKINIVEEVKERAFNNGPEYREILDQKGAGEYAIYGWFRYTSTALKTPNNCIMRLTNNEQGYRGEISRVGDRTLLVMLQPGEYVFATYSLGNIDNGQIVNIRKPTPYKTNLGVWTYIYFGYNFQKRKASGIIKYPSGYALVPYENVLHMVPNYLLFFFGGDGMLGGWHGQMQKVNLLFGKGAFVDSTKGNFAEKLPNLMGVESKPLIWDGIDNKIIEVPIADRPALDIVFNKDVNGFIEYGYGLWTRWLTTIPKRIVEKAPFHQLIRLCSTEQYEDAAQFGNRVLAIWVGKGYYHFTTYNKIGNKISTSQNINYDDNFEGEWNYIYYSFTNKQQARAVGFVHFSEQAGTAISRVEFLNLEHMALNGYARVVAANKEFGYQPFNGMIADLQIHLGNGFIGSREQLIKEIIQLNPKPSMNIQSKMDVNLINTEVIIKPEEKKEMKYKYDQYKGVNEYAVSGWIQSKVMGQTDAYRNVFRLTINPPEFQKDKQNAGDRTLALFQSKTKLAFSTYTYGIFDTQGDDNNEFNRIINSGNSNGEWVFIYFGYQFKSKQAFAFTLFLNRQDSAQFNNIKHFVPNQFFFYLSNDGYYPIFDGSLFDWNLYFGEGAFTKKPRQMINQWPIEPIGEFEGVISALLSNQGLNSMKIIRPEKKENEEIVFKNNFPKSGTISGNPAPRSGQTQVDPQQPKPISQTIVKQPQSGQVDYEKQQQQQQQQQQARKPLSGIANQK